MSYNLVSTDEKPMISVCLLTYNQEDYIRECLDSILMQNVSCKYEIVVGDDCSTDSTQEILREYEKRFPNIFHMILRDKNVGITNNLYDVLMNCKGKYIAGLEGDDYWIDENKLQIQFDFLETHKEYIGCSHAVKMVDELGQIVPMGTRYFDEVHWAYYQDDFTFKQFKKFQMPGQGSSWFYRNIYPEKKYDYSVIKKVSPMIGDRTVMMILSAQGKWFYMMDKTMTCYRFVNETDKQSWASWRRNNYNPLIDYNMYYNLEKYARELFNVKLDFKDKKYRIITKTRKLIKQEYDYSKREKYREALSEMWGKSKPKTYYSSKFLYDNTIDKVVKYVLYRLYAPTVMYAYKENEIFNCFEGLKDNTWRKFKKETAGKTIVLFGSGEGCREVLNRYGQRYYFTVTLDNNIKRIDKPLYTYRRKRDLLTDNYNYVFVMSPEEMEKWEKDKFVILITSTLYQDQIAKQLSDLGFNTFFSYGVMEGKKWRYRLIKKSDVGRRKVR